MTPHVPSYVRQLFTLLLWGLIYYLAGLISLKFDDPDSPIAIVWFPSGVAVAAFLLTRWRSYLSLFVILTLAGLFLRAGWQHNPLISLTDALLSMPANVAIAWAVRRFARLNDDLHTILICITATLIFSGLDALIIGGGYALINHQPLFSLFWQNFIADVTGIIFATTVIMGFINRRLDPAGCNLPMGLLGGALWLLLCVSVWFIFGYPFLWLQHNAAALYFALACLPIILAIMLSVAWGHRGGSLALLTLGLGVIYYTNHQHGPFFLKGLHLNESLLLALSYLSATALLIVFIRVLKHSTNSFNPDTGRITGKGVIYSLNPRTGILHWEDELSSLFEQKVPSKLDTMDGVMQWVHPHDQGKLRDHWLLNNNPQFRPPLVFRIQMPQGEWLTLVDTSSVLLDEEEQSIIVGNWQASHYHQDS
ncbi:MASE1 domain-containing protein [Serratia sp. (in: enterobacteria)]|uniref:MASE1 domain-containing protein n=1 Tax=Serratia sp. (in: enterobacteria) TaxID=616 RepID=UPI0039890BBD